MPITLARSILQNAISAIKQDPDFSEFVEDDIVAETYSLSNDEMVGVLMHIEDSLKAEHSLEFQFENAPCCKLVGDPNEKGEKIMSEMSLTVAEIEEKLIELDLSLIHI